MPKAASPAPRARGPPPPLTAPELTALPENIRTCSDPVPRKNPTRPRKPRLALVPPRVGAQTRFTHVVEVHDEYKRIDLVKDDMDRQMYPAIGFVWPPRYGIFMQLKVTAANGQTTESKKTYLASYSSHHIKTRDHETMKADRSGLQPLYSVYLTITWLREQLRFRSGDTLVFDYEGYEPERPSLGETPAYRLHHFRVSVIRQNGAGPSVPRAAVPRRPRCALPATDEDDDEDDIEIVEEEAAGPSQGAAPPRQRAAQRPRRGVNYAESDSEHDQGGDDEWHPEEEVEVEEVEEEEAAAAADGTPPAHRAESPRSPRRAAPAGEEADPSAKRQRRQEASPVTPSPAAQVAALVTAAVEAGTSRQPAAAAATMPQTTAAPQGQAKADLGPILSSKTVPSPAQLTLVLRRCGIEKALLGRFMAKFNRAAAEVKADDWETLRALASENDVEAVATYVEGICGA